MNEIFSKLSSFGIGNVEIDLTFYSYSQKFAYSRVTSYQLLLPRRLTKNELDELFLIPSILQMEQLLAKENKSYLLVTI